MARSDADLLIDRAQRAANLLNFPQAKSIYEQVIDEFPEDVRGYVYYAQLLSTLGHRDAALKEFNRALRRQPESFIALAGKAEFLESPPNPNLNEALKIYNTIYELSKDRDDPELVKQAAFAKDRMAYCEARKLSLQSRRYLKSNSSAKAIQKAREMLEEALKTYPGDKRNYMNLGVAHLRLEEFSKARDVFLKAIDLDHKYARAFLNLGRAYHGLGHLRRARDAFRSCVSLTTRQADSSEARAMFIQVEREMAQQRADFYDFLLGRSQEEGGPAPMSLPNMKDVITMLTGDDILQADVARLDNASYTIQAFSERKRYRVSPGPEGLNIEQDMITVV